MRTTVMQNNSASAQGGAVVVSDAASLDASGCLFQSNTVVNKTLASNPSYLDLMSIMLVDGPSVGDAYGVVGLGGAMFVSSSAPVLLSSSSVVDNLALFGGGIHTDAASSISVGTAVKLHGNRAVFDGGAVYLTDSAVVKLRGGVNITVNSADRNGGGIAAVLNSTLELGDGVQVFDNNAAVDGGGIYTANASILHFNGTSSANGVLVIGNVARVSGGGFCLLSDGYPWDLVKAAASLNTALYGADTYVPTERLQVINGTQVNVTSRVDASGVQVTINATGRRGRPSELMVQASLEGVLLDTLKTASTTGLATFNVPLKKPPGQYNLTFTSPKDYGNMTFQTSILINVKGCLKGDVVANTGDACVTCVAGSFSMDPRNTTCDNCDDNAVCPGGWAVLPKEGFWSSSPYSTQIHRWAFGD